MDPRGGSSAVPGSFMNDPNGQLRGGGAGAGMAFGGGAGAGVVQIQDEQQEEEDDFCRDTLMNDLTNTGVISALFSG